MQLSEVIQFFEVCFPKNLVEDWDTSGLTIGELNKQVKKIALSCDVTPETIKQAANESADLLFTHHPFLFKPTNLLGEDTTKGALLSELIKNNLAHYNAHTNADKVDEFGVAAVCYKILLNSPEDASSGISFNQALGLGEIGLGRIGELKVAVTLKELAVLVNKRVRKFCPFEFETRIRFAGNPDSLVKKIAILPGSGDSEFETVRELEADVYITSDLRHHPVQDQLTVNWANSKTNQNKALNIIEVPHPVIESLWLNAFAEKINSLGLETVVLNCKTESWSYFD